MAEPYLIRFAQASFGADNYDKLSELGNKQSYALGKALASQGMQLDTWIMSEIEAAFERGFPLD